MFDKVVNFLKKIEQNNNIKIEEEASNFKNFELPDEEALNWALEDIKEDFGVLLDKKILFTDNFKAKWGNSSTLKNKKEIIYGGFDLSIYNGVIGSRDEWLDENPLDHSQGLVDNLYSFNDSEIVRHMSQNGRGCFYREHGKWPLDIYFFDAGVCVKMDLSLDEYIQAMIDSCAVAYWQYFYVDIKELITQNAKITLREGGGLNNVIIKGDKIWDSPRLPYLLHELDVFVRNLPDVFPDNDFSYHKSRLSQIKEAAQPYL